VWPNFYQVPVVPSQSLLLARVSCRVPLSNTTTGISRLTGGEVTTTEPTYQGRTRREPFCVRTTILSTSDKQSGQDEVAIDVYGHIRVPGCSTSNCTDTGGRHTVIACLGFAQLRGTLSLFLHDTCSWLLDRTSSSNSLCRRSASYRLRPAQPAPSPTRHASVPTNLSKMPPRFVS
jgi:hypothetical protein